jgi:hypothetical protein
VPPDLVHDRPRQELTVELVRRGEQLHRSYRRPGRWETLPALTTPWPEVEAHLHPRIGAGRTGNGVQLFYLLFGSDDDWKTVLHPVFDEPPGSRTTPTWRAVRLRIVTAEPRLRALAWGRAAWGERRLADDGWTFEVAAQAQPQRSVVTPSPCSVLVATAPGGPLAAAVREVLGELWRHLPEKQREAAVRVVHSSSELETALDELRPHLVLLSGPAAEGSTLALGADRLALRALPALFEAARHHPTALAVHLQGAEPAALGPDLPSFPAVPLSLWRQIPNGDETPAAAGWIAAWLRRWLGHVEDPVLAFHAVLAADEGPAGLVCSDYRLWSTHPPPAAPERPWTALHTLDRREQKALVARELRGLVREDRQRVLALVAYAEPGNAVASLAEQLEHDLEVDDDHLPINWYRPRFPLHRRTLVADLEAMLQLDLGANSGEQAPALLRRRAPRDLRSGTRGIVWLNWGIFGDGPGHQPRLAVADLKDWVRFSCERLVPLCPPDIRLVSFLALETEERHHEKLKRALFDIESEPFCRLPGFTLTVLDPLGKVPERDLRRFLRDHGCPEELIGANAELLHARTGGRFEETVPWLEQARATSWNDLHTALRGGEATPALREDDLL